MNTSQPQLNNLPESDLELLSAYIDNELTAAERVNLERRLSSEPALKAEFDELRSATGLLRELETVRPPRSFALDPATAPRPRRFVPWAWMMQLSSGLAGLALVLLATVQFMAGGNMAGAPMAAREAPAAQAPAGAAAQMMAPTAAPTPEVLALATAAPAATTAPPMAAVQSESAPAEATDSMAARESAPAGDTNSTADNSAPYAISTLPPGVGSAGGATSGFGPTSGPTPEITAKEPASPGTLDLPAQTAPVGPVSAGFPAGLTLGIGIMLIALAVGWGIYSRSR